MEEQKDFEYDVKCRKCGKIVRMYFGKTTKANFKVWVDEHMAFPIKKQCTCDNGMMLLHDIVGFGRIMDIL